MRWWSLALVLCACGSGAERPPVVVDFVAQKPNTPIAIVPKPQPPEPVRHAVIEIAGSFWAGRDSDGDQMSLEFRADGKLHYKSPTGDYTNGTWEQHGERVTWETNNHYADYEAHVDGDVMEGSAHNTASHDWTFRYQHTATFDERVDEIPSADDP